MKWPLDKDFAFTIIDDTDGATLENIEPLYNFLLSKNIKTTKTVWIYPPKDKFTGHTIQDKEYLAFLLKLEQQGFEIQLHNVGSGNFKRDEIIEGFNIFKDKFDRFPSMHINHSSNQDNLYWGYKRYGFILKSVFKILKGRTRRYYGDEIKSENFWGDLSKKHIKYIRNRVFNGINTLKYDPKMPFKEKNKKYSNYWFSSSDGHTVQEFNNLITESNIDKLKKQKGLCIVYTHFSCGFLNENDEINSEFKKNIDFLSKQNGWFVPASEILEYLRDQKKESYVNFVYINMLDFKWVFERLIKIIKYGR